MPSAPTGVVTAVAAVRRAVATALPAGASVLVVSRGDPELVRLPDHRGRHFPSTTDGRYAGFHPADSAAALRELESRLGDAEYLVIPASSFWWLDFYRELAEVLNDRHERVWSDADCVIYRLASGIGASPRAALAPIGNGATSGATNGAHGDAVVPVPADRVARGKRTGLPGGLLN